MPKNFLVYILAHTVHINPQKRSRNHGIVTIRITRHVKTGLPKVQYHEPPLPGKVSAVNETNIIRDYIIHEVKASPTLYGFIKVTIRPASINVTFIFVSTITALYYQVHLIVWQQK